MTFLRLELIFFQAIGWTCTRRKLGLIQSFFSILAAKENAVVSCLSLQRNRLSVLVGTEKFLISLEEVAEDKDGDVSFEV